MISIPSFILRRLYVKGSLRNIEGGIQFSLLNKLGSGYARRFLPLTLDDEEIPIGRCIFLVDDTKVPFEKVSPDCPFTIALNKETRVVVTGAYLTPEPHRICFRFEVGGLGVLELDFIDTPSDG